jgi:hypothetical protein
MSLTAELGLAHIINGAMRMAQPFASPFLIRYDFRATCVRFRTYAVSALMGGLEGCAARAPPPCNSCQTEIRSRNVVKCEHDLIQERVDKSQACE